jgi:hypothetical protein
MFAITVRDNERRYTWNITCQTFCEARTKAISQHKEVFKTNWAEVVAISHYYRGKCGR